MEGVDGQKPITYTYSPYGQVSITRGDSTSSYNWNPFLYTGREAFNAALSIYNYRSRHYFASLGRFGQPDSFPGFLTRPGSLNKYMYVEGRPVNWGDPWGMSLWDCYACVNGLMSFLVEASAWTIPELKLGKIALGGWGASNIISDFLATMQACERCRDTILGEYTVDTVENPDPYGRGGARWRDPCSQPLVDCLSKMSGTDTSSS